MISCSIKEYGKKRSVMNTPERRDNGPESNVKSPNSAFYLTPKRIFSSSLCIGNNGFLQKLMTMPGPFIYVITRLYCSLRGE